MRRCASHAVFLFTGMAAGRVGSGTWGAGRDPSSTPAAVSQTLRVGHRHAPGARTADRHACLPPRRAGVADVPRPARTGH